MAKRMQNSSVVGWVAFGIIAFGVFQFGARATRVAAPMSLRAIGNLRHNSAIPFCVRAA